MVVEVGPAQEKSSPEKVAPNDNTAGLVVDQEVQDGSDSWKSNKEKTCCHVFLMLLFVLLFASTAYFSYQNFQYKHEIKKCEKAQQAVDNFLNQPLATIEEQFFDRLNTIKKNSHDQREPYVKNGDIDEPLFRPRPFPRPSGASHGNYDDSMDGNDDRRPFDDNSDVSQDGWQEIADELKSCIIVTEEPGLKRTTINAPCLGRKLMEKKRVLCKLFKNILGDFFSFRLFHRPQQ